MVIFIMPSANWIAWEGMLVGLKGRLVLFGLIVYRSEGRRLLFRIENAVVLDGLGRSAISKRLVIGNLLAVASHHWPMSENARMGLRAYVWKQVGSPSNLVPLFYIGVIFWKQGLGFILQDLFVKFVNFKIPLQFCHSGNLGLYINNSLHYFLILSVDPLCLLLLAYKV